ncbi:MAG: dephospho-CoA kinase [Bdellovibrionota bacterium]
MFEVWGVTGVIGSGKSTAMRIISEMGYPGIDADQVSRIVVDKKTEEGKKGFEQIYRAFGSGVLNSLGELDRPALRRRMMQNPDDHKALEAIMHPLIVDYITRTMTKWKAAGTKLAFVEGTRLIESGFHNMLTGIIVVTAKEDQKIKRVMKRDSMGKDEVSMMVRMQDETLMKRIAKAEWKNEASEAAFKKIIQAFVETRMKQAG